MAIGTYRETLVYVIIRKTGMSRPDPNIMKSERFPTRSTREPEQRRPDHGENVQHTEEEAGRFQVLSVRFHEEFHAERPERENCGIEGHAEDDEVPVRSPKAEDFLQNYLICGCFGAPGRNSGRRELPSTRKASTPEPKPAPRPLQSAAATASSSSIPVPRTASSGQRPIQAARG